MNRVVEFKHDISDEVKVPIGKAYIHGRISQMSICVSGLKYCVVYWADGDRVEQWLYEWELD